MSIRPRILGGSAGDIHVLVPPAQDGVRANGSVLAVEVIRPQPEAAPEFDWEQCVADFDEGQIEQLAKWRGYSRDFCRWLHSKSLIGLYDGHVAFPVIDQHQQVIACHYRADDKHWLYHPTGNKTTALVLGDPDAPVVWAFESQWDAFAVMDRLGWHTDDDLRKAAAVVITRGAANGKLIGGKCRPDTRVYAFAQNDRADAQGNSPAKAWLDCIVKYAGCPTSLVKIPGEYKDANEWTKAGASEADIRAAVESSKPEPLHGEAALKVNQDVFIVLPGHDVSIVECAEKLFPLMAATETLFSRNGTVTEVVKLKDQMTLQKIGSQSFRSRIEEHGRCMA